MKWRSLAAALFLTLLGATVVGASSLSLQIYLEDNHAGSFHWLAQNLDLEEAHTLVHFDAHSDASAIFDSDGVREKIRRVASREARAELLEEWRRDGVVQCFDWIEPLLPRPFERVIWVPGEATPPGRARGMERLAVEYLDGHLEAAPRASGSMKGRYVVRDLRELERTFVEGPPLVVSIDLDSFAGLPATAATARFERMWKWTSERRNLRAVTIAISRPFLRDDAEAHRLVEMVLRAALSLPTARLQFEPYRSVGKDRSALAQRLRAAGRPVPAYDLAGAPESLRALLLSARDRLRTAFEVPRLAAQLEQWSREAARLRVIVRGHDPSADGIWRVPADTPCAIELAAEPWFEQPGSIEWFAEVPVHPSCNLMASDREFIGFAADAPPRPRWRRERLESRGPELSSTALRRHLDETTGCGAVRVMARAQLGACLRETPPIELRFSRGSGFRAAVLEQFRLPYLLGSGLLTDDSASGPETGWGADCANFVVAAFRRTGHRIPWSDPRQLRSHLFALATQTTPGAVRFTPEDLEAGIVVHLGTHAAALIEDRPPLGVLDANDLVAHQLEGFPELVPLGQFLRARKQERFDVLCAPRAEVNPLAVIGGDVMLGRSIGVAIEAGLDPLAGIAPLLRAAPLVVANLECVLGSGGEARPDRRYALRAPASAATALRAAGFHAMGLANNHSDDFGADGQAVTLAALKAAGLGAIGTAAGGSYADPQGRIAVIALNAVPAEPDAAPGMDGLLDARDRPAVLAAIQGARARAPQIIALVHWGEENTARVTDEQRELTRWLILEGGVDAIVGAHPHCLQPVDFLAGRPVIYSLGNLVLDGAPSVPHWNRGALAAFHRAGGQTLLPRLIPVQLDARGFPEPVVRRRGHDGWAAWNSGE